MRIDSPEKSPRVDRMSIKYMQQGHRVLIRGLEAEKLAAAGVHLGLESFGENMRAITTFLLHINTSESSSFFDKGHQTVESRVQFLVGVMELTQQVKNHKATLGHSRPNQPKFNKEDHNEDSHRRGLQSLSNGNDVPYQQTLRQVTCEGSPVPVQPPKQTLKHPGYIRNESGGLFTS
eukprot:gene8358-3438_t